MLYHHLKSKIKVVSDTNHLEQRFYAWLVTIMLHDGAIGDNFNEKINLFISGPFV